MEGRGEGDSRVRCFVVGCLGGGGGSGGCKASVDGVGVVSVDKERKGVKADTMRRRGACVTVDNILEDVFKQGRRLGNAVTAGWQCFRSGSGNCRLPTWYSTLDYISMFPSIDHTRRSRVRLPSSRYISETLRPQSTFAPVSHPFHRRKRRADPTRALGGERQVRFLLSRPSSAEPTSSPMSLDNGLDAP